MTRAEWDEWIPRQTAGYAEHIAASGAMSEADAWQKAKNDTARFFHAGFETPGAGLPDHGGGRGGGLALAGGAGSRS